MTNKIKDLLSSLSGVISVTQIKREDFDTIKKIEYSYEQSQLIPLVNLGLQNVLERETVFVILKDCRFRKPPRPTIYMVEDVADNAKCTQNCLEINGKFYHIIGEEILDKETEFREKHICIGDGFVLFPERRSGHSKVPAYFLIPPIGFSELEANQDILHIENIMSVSPSTMTDQCLRNLYNLSKETAYATILVGFDTMYSDQYSILN
ncbi:MAG: hypothetical protein AB1798_20850 [Spirochaetota bacterium]